jgi:hypothetical protein
LTFLIAQSTRAVLGEIRALRRALKSEALIACREVARQPLESDDDE